VCLRVPFHGYALLSAFLTTFVFASRLASIQRVAVHVHRGRDLGFSVLRNIDFFYLGVQIWNKM